MRNHYLSWLQICSKKELKIFENNEKYSLDQLNLLHTKIMYMGDHSIAQSGRKISPTLVKKTVISQKTSDVNHNQLRSC